MMSCPSLSALNTLWLIFSLSLSNLFADQIILTGEVREISGPDDLALIPAETVVAFDANGAEERLINGVTFLTNENAISNVTLEASRSISDWAPRPSFTGADASSVNEFERVMESIRWELSPEIINLTVDGLTPGEEYRVQLLFNEGRNRDRRFDIGIEGELAVDDFSTSNESSWTINNSFIYEAFVTLEPGDTAIEVTLARNLGGQAPRGSDNNPILNGFIVTRIAFSPAPSSLLLERTGFFADQSASVGQLTTIDDRDGANHLYALIENFGDNEKFLIDDDALTLNPAHNFSNDPIGTTYNLRIRTADADQPNRFLEQDFTLTLQTPLAPTLVSLSGDSLGLGTAINTTIGTLQTTDPNGIDEHSYQFVTGTGSTHNSLFTISGEQVILTSPIPSDLTSLSLRVRSQDLSGLSTTNVITLALIESSFLINEVMAANSSTLGDEDAEFNDWVEIINPTPGVGNLNGWYLSNDSDNLTRWQFPETSIAPSGYLVLFASGKNRATSGSELHLNFALNSGGGTLYLVRPDGLTIADEFTFPESFPDVSYGRGSDGSELGFLRNASPGEANGTTSPDVVNNVTFSQTRGLYTAPFSLTLTADLPGSIIRYTTNGSDPTPTTGTLYSGPFTVSPESASTRRGTRRVRAIALSPDAAVSPVATHSYVWLDEVLDQSVFQEAITADPSYGPQMLAGLADLPVVSITKPSGISGAEEQTSIELLSHDGSEPGFQIDCGIKIVGGDSVESPKNNFRCFFRSRYGAGKLRYPVFEDSPYTTGASEEFDVLQLRSGSHDSFFWMAEPQFPLIDLRHGDAQYVRNRWISDVEMLMGLPSLHGRYVHCYLNGSYHGLYHLHERPMHHFMEKYFGGDSEDYHFTNAAKSGSDHGNGDTWQSAWNQVRTAASAGGLSSQDWINWQSFADTQLLNYYCGNDWDWNPRQNWMAAGPKNPGEGGWRFFNWDRDVMIYDTAANNLRRDAPDGVFRNLIQDPDFLVYFTDRVYKHCFHDGLLTPGNIQASHDFRMNEIFKAIVPETARWQPRAEADLPNPPWDRDQEWTAEWDYVRDVFWPGRTEVLLDQLRARGWYPVEAPEFFPNGGPITPGASPDISAPAGTVYYTVDGSDPRLPGGAINPAASILNTGFSISTLVPRGSSWRYLDDGSNQGSAWTALNFNDNSWSTGDARLGYGNGGEDTVISYGNNAQDKHITTYFRREFTVTNISDITALSLKLQRDDGAAVYLNGTEVWRSNLPAGNITSETLASTSAVEADEVTFFNSPAISPSLLREGTNVLAVEVHQITPGSSDLSFDLELCATVPDDPSNLVINENLQINARVKMGSDWSAINTVRFTQGDPADETNLVISEFSYRPARASVAEDPGNLYSRTDFEFIELTNISDNLIHLDGAAFVEGIRFDFADTVRFSIPAGESRLLVENMEAFLVRYPSVNPEHIMAEYDGNLSNDGERIALITADNFVIRDFTYNDQRPWPTAADGDGYSLELIDYQDNPDHTFGQNWRSSRGIHGSPTGEITAQTFAQWQAANFSSSESAFSGANDDPDNDGRSNFFEFALGTSPRENDNRVTLPTSQFIEIDNETYLSFTYDIWSGASGLTHEIEVSDNLSDWDDTAADLVRVAPPVTIEPGVTRHTYRMTSPISNFPRKFIRLRVR